MDSWIWLFKSMPPSIVMGLIAIHGIVTCLVMREYCMDSASCTRATQWTGQMFVVATTT